ncbi:hypothetical protein MSAN_00441000 [Mycena sanguinolenta]|uniref:Uncharacterized protein n=1 Tax=Mycena sanguinolenta TaxID=230812 RepID=A0A8H6ZAJ3_9AGAR|nr:hypothetical protein MSAN_00441000 [Mycena sanguinolenta]
MTQMMTASLIMTPILATWTPRTQAAPLPHLLHPPCPLPFSPSSGDINEPLQFLCYHHTLFRSTCIFGWHLKRPRDTLHTCLHTCLYTMPTLFCTKFHIWPLTFNKLIWKLELHPVFTNNSNAGQTPVDIQVAVMLYQFGHSGNGVSLQTVSWWLGLGKGTILQCTCCVITAILGTGMLKKYVCMPTAAEKEHVKEWVEK